MKGSNIQMLPGGIVVHHHKVPVPGVSRKIIYQFNDTHLALSDSDSTGQETKAAEERSAAWLGIREGFARQYDQPYTDEQKLSAETHFENLLRYAVSDGDAVILCGDIFDYLSGANLRFYESRLQNVSIPVMAVCGNHEPAADIPDGFLFSAVREPVQVTEMDDLILVGFDNSLREITEEQNECLLKVLQKSKPVIVAMHVPVMTDENAHLLRASGEYFRLNPDGASETTLTFIEILKRHAAQIIAVFAGHLHYPNVSEIAPGLTQYVSTQGILGNINRYEIGG